MSDHRAGPGSFRGTGEYDDPRDSGRPGRSAPRGYRGSNDRVAELRPSDGRSRRDRGAPDRGAPDRGAPEQAWLSDLAAPADERDSERGYERPRHSAEYDFREAARQADEQAGRYGSPDDTRRYPADSARYDGAGYENRQYDQADAGTDDAEYRRPSRPQAVSRGRLGLGRRVDTGEYPVIRTEPAAERWESDPEPEPERWAAEPEAERRSPEPEPERERWAAEPTTERWASEAEPERWARDPEPEPARWAPEPEPERPAFRACRRRHPGPAPAPRRSAPPAGLPRPDRAGRRGVAHQRRAAAGTGLRAGNPP